MSHHSRGNSRNLGFGFFATDLSVSHYWHRRVQFAQGVREINRQLRLNRKLNPCVPRSGHVAVTAIRIGARMVPRLSLGKNAVMAGGAVIHDADMVKRSGTKTGRVVTHAAILRGRNVISRLSSRGGAVMARGTIIGNAGMIKARTGKARRVVAYGTVLRCRNVSGRHSDRCRSVMARRTVVGDSGVIEHSRRKGSRYVANAAVLCRRNMARGLAERRGTVVT